MSENHISPRSSIQLEQDEVQSGGENMFDLGAVFFLVGLAVIAFVSEEILNQMDKKEWVKMVNLGLGIIGLLFLLEMLQGMLRVVRSFGRW